MRNYDPIPIIPSFTTVKTEKNEKVICILSDEEPEEPLRKTTPTKVNPDEDAKARTKALVEIAECLKENNNLIQQIAIVTLKQSGLMPNVQVMGELVNGVLQIRLENVGEEKKDDQTD